MINSEGKLVVNSSGEGAVFVEAEADCEMEKIGDVTKPDPDTLGKLVYDIPGTKNILEMPLLVSQVCNFSSPWSNKKCYCITIPQQFVHIICLIQFLR